MLTKISFTYDTIFKGAEYFETEEPILETEYINLIRTKYPFFSEENINVYHVLEYVEGETKLQ